MRARGFIALVAAAFEAFVGLDSYLPQYQGASYRTPRFIARTERRVICLEAASHFVPQRLTDSETRAEKAILRWDENGVVILGQTCYVS